MFTKNKELEDVQILETATDFLETVIAFLETVTKIRWKHLETTWKQTTSYECFQEY